MEPNRMTITKKIMGNTIGELNILESFIHRPILRHQGNPGELPNLSSAA
jgi:hypothetical protein